jgi:hypothetical protein
MDLREIGCEDGRWIELAQDRVQWWAFVLAVLKPRVLLTTGRSATVITRTSAALPRQASANHRDELLCALSER